MGNAGFCPSTVLLPFFHSLLTKGRSIHPKPLNPKLIQEAHGLSLAAFSRLTGSEFRPVRCEFSGLNRFRVQGFRGLGFGGLGF